MSTRKTISHREAPNPGSDAAVAAGCTCPRMDNARGRGAMGTSGDDAVFWKAAECPLHGSGESEDEA